MTSTVTEDLKFSEHLQGKDGLDTVHSRVYAEIKILEQMETYVEKRAHLDLEYGEKLGRLHDKIEIKDTDIHIDGSQIEKAWRTYMTESENKAINIVNMSKMLSATQHKIKTLRMKKKEMADQLKKNNQKIEAEFSRNLDDMERLKILYQSALKEAGKLKDKLDDTYTKNKGARDWQKAKERFDQASRKLHMNHNEYFLSIHALNEHLKNKMNSLIPHVLDYCQDLQEQFLPPWKDIFLELVSNTSWGRSEFITSEDELKQSIELVNPKTEFVAFLTNFQKQKPMVPYLFDTSLTQNQNATSGLTPDMLAINDLTNNQLHNKHKTFSDEDITFAKNIEIKEREYEEQYRTWETMNASENNNAIFNTIEQSGLCHSLQLELKELKCKCNINKIQQEIVNDALANVADPTRPYIDLSPPQSTATIGGSTSNISKSEDTIKDDRKEGAKHRATTLPRLLPKNFLRRDSIKGSPNKPDDKNERNHSLTSEGSDASYDQPEQPLESCDWFHGKIDRATVQRLLKIDGDFIVRAKSDQSGDNVLSVLWRSQIKHFILKQDNGMYKLEGESFPTIQQLINHHYEKRLIVQSSTGIILMNPIRVIFRPGDQYTFNHSNVRLDQKLGSGHFGDVYRGKLMTTQLQVAVKTLKLQQEEMNQKQKFIEEAEIMKMCKHKNVVEFIGICKDQDPYYIVLELCEKGDLLKLLREEAVRMDVKQFIQMSIDVAAGMAYLESKQIIHRDLAARNCLVKDDYTVKICDFGMSREEDDNGIYNIKETKVIPFKWSAPEVWQYNRYTSKTDIWSYGVVLWEIFSGGKQPYTGWNNMQARKQVEQGFRLPAPSGTPTEIYNIMTSCWDATADLRPTFQEVYGKIKQVKK